MITLSKLLGNKVMKYSATTMYAAQTPATSKTTTMTKKMGWRKEEGRQVISYNLRSYDSQGRLKANDK